MSEELGLPTLPERADASHKGNYGRVLVVAGSTGMTGAAALAADAALRAGAGLVTLACPRTCQPVLAAKLTAVMTRPVADTADGSLSPAALGELLELCAGADAVVLGPGLSRHPGTAFLARRVVGACPAPLLVDADGLNAVAGDPTCLDDRPAPTVLTPHPGEMARLVASSTGEVQAAREGTARTLARRHGVVVCLKGHETVVTDGERTAVNRTGNPGLATGGTGDVLSGIGGALLARLEPAGAARLACHVHGLAGDVAAERRGREGMTAEDVLEAVPEAIRRLGSD